MDGEPDRWLLRLGPLDAMAFPCRDEDVIAHAMGAQFVAVLRQDADEGFLAVPVGGGGFQAGDIGKAFVSAGEQEMRKARGNMLFQEYKKKMGMVQPDAAAAAQQTPPATPERQKIAEQ